MRARVLKVGRGARTMHSTGAFIATTSAPVEETALSPRSWVARALFILALASSGASSVWADNAPGVTATEIKFGQTIALSGPASAYSVVGRAEAAYFRMINEQGGVNGRKLNFLDVDDAYSPPKTIEQTRRLVEQEGVAFLFNGVGTTVQLAVRPYLNAQKIPQLFSAFGIVDPEHYPWTLPFFQLYATEAAIYAHYTLQTRPEAKVAILYQNDDLGRTYLKGFVDGLGPEHAGMIVKTASYEVSAPTVDSEVISLQASGADVLLIAASPKFAAQAIRKTADLGWKPTRYLAVVSSTIAGVLKPAGLENSRDLVTAIPSKDVTDPRWRDDPDVKAFAAFVDKYMTPADLTSNAAAYGYQSAALLVHVLGQCANDLSRENIMRQATHIQNLALPLGLPGVTINTSPTDYRMIRQYQLQRFDGEHWKLFGELLTD
jgi:ABC-type branched-subunit amino acid transport system substrate-binding protein